MAIFDGARRRRSYPATYPQTSGGGGGGNVPQPPDTTGAFAHFPLTEGLAAATLKDVIGGRDLTGGTVVNIARHPIYPDRTMIRPGGSVFTSLVDAAWGSIDQTVELIVYPHTTGAAFLWELFNATRVCGALQWGAGVWNYQYFNGVFVTPTGYWMPGFGSAFSDSNLPYLLRIERDRPAAVTNVRFYVNGYPILPVLTDVDAPPLADRIRMPANSPAWQSDIIVWQTGTPPVTALDQARRVFPWLIA